MSEKIEINTPHSSIDVIEVRTAGETLDAPVDASDLHFGPEYNGEGRKKVGAGVLRAVGRPEVNRTQVTSEEGPEGELIFADFGGRVVYRGEVGAEAAEDIAA